MKSLIHRVGVSVAALALVTVVLVQTASALHGPIIKHEKGPAARAHAAEHRAAKTERQQRAKPEHGFGHGGCGGCF